MKKFLGSGNSTGPRPDDTQVVLVPGCGTHNVEQQQLQTSKLPGPELEEQDEDVNEETGHTYAPQTTAARYPQRNRRPPKRFEDCVSWDLSPEGAEKSGDPNGSDSQL